MAQSQFDIVSAGNALDLPPPFEGRNVVELSSSKDGRITHVRVYSNSAEVTRVFKVPVKVGNNQVVISGFPDAINDQSLRHEIKGPASIRDVKVSEEPYKPVPITNDKIQSLNEQRERANTYLTRAYSGLSAIEDYLEEQKRNSAADLKDLAEEYAEATAELDDRIADLKKEIADIDKELAQERKALAVEVVYDYMTVTIGIFGESEDEVDLTLHYGVNQASWIAAYDIYLNTNTKEKRVNVVYKASITQSTGESWDNVPITLDTSTPSSNISYRAQLYPWKLSMYVPPPPPPPPVPAPAAPAAAPAPVVICPPTRSPSPYLAPVPPAPIQYQPYGCYYPSVDSFGAPINVTPPRRRNRRRTTFNSIPWGPIDGVTATLNVPGLTSVASDNVKHTVTVMELEMDAETFYCATPRTDVAMNHKMKVTNTTKYPLKGGSANIFVNGSLVAHHTISLVVPNETFECPLGLDSSIRMEFPPVKQAITHSSKFLSLPFKAKTTKHTFTQVISVVNTKSHPVSNVQISDHIPTSDDDSIRVRLISPSLPVPGKDTNLEKKVNVSDGVVVNWADKTSGDMWGISAVRKGNAIGAEDGLVNWTCAIPAGGRVEILLKWEVKVPQGKIVNRLLSG